MRLKGIRLCAALLPFVLIAAACGSDKKATTSSSSSSGSQAVAGTIKIGAQAAVTGGAAAIGVGWKKGLEMGVAQVNANGGVTVDGKRYNFEIAGGVQDNTTKPETAVGIAQGMIRDNIKFIFGPSVTTLFQPTWESLKGADAIVVTASTLASTLIGKPEAKHLFWSKVPDQGESGAITLNARALIERWKPKTAAVLLPADPAGQVHHDTYIKEFKAAGVNVVYEDTFEGTTQDFAPFITKIKDANPDVVVFGYLDRWGTPFLDQAAAAGLTSPHFAMSPGTTFAALKDRTTLSAALSMPTRVVDNADDAQLADWRKAYKDEFGSDPVPNDFWMLSYYDTVRMLAKAMTIANSMTDLDAITAAMKTPQAGDYPVRALRLTYDSKGGATYPQQNVFFEKGKVEYVDLKG